MYTFNKKNNYPNYTQPETELELNEFYYYNNKPAYLFDFTDNNYMHRYPERNYSKTRLIVEKQPKNLEGYQVYTAHVSWYRGDDNENLQTGFSYARDTATEITIELDIDALKNNREYQRVLFTELLYQKRVDEHIQAGLENRNINGKNYTCGNYVGNVHLNGKRLLQ